MEREGQGKGMFFEEVLEITNKKNYNIILKNYNIMFFLKY